VRDSIPFAPTDPPPTGRDRVRGVRIGGIYRVERELGRGAMGIIVEAEDTVLKRRVAIKLPLHADAAAMLLTEGRALAALDHPSLPAVHAAGEHDGRPFLVMELLNGTSLAARLESARSQLQPVGLPEALSLLISLTEGLEAIHAAGIAHHDIKPENVLLCKRGPVLIDFGMVVPEYNATDQRVYGGSPLYVSPEVIQQNEARGAGQLSDLYSLGILAYELLTGVVPYDADNLDTLLRLHVEAPIPDARMLRPNVPSALAELVKELMAKRAGERPQGAEEVAWRLRKVRTSVEGQLVPTEHDVLILSGESDLCSQLDVGLGCGMHDVNFISGAAPTEALDLLERRTPSLIIVDLRLAGAGGVEFLMQVRGGDLDASTAIVGLLDEAAASDLELVRHLDVLSLVPKGPRMMSMLEQVARNTLAPPSDRSRASLA
jgi:serine/threonine protein kinase